MLNHASLESPDAGTAITWLIDVARGMATLAESGIVQNSLRMDRPMWEINCAPGRTLHEIAFDAQQTKARDEITFLLRRAVRFPLIDRLNPQLNERFRSCEHAGLDVSAEDGAPLVLCAISDSIAVGFPSHSAWDCDCIAVEFDELHDNGAINRVVDWVDNLTRSSHATAILDRHRCRIVDHLLEISSVEEVWERRSIAFPNLRFGLDVEQHLRRVNTGSLTTIINKLSELQIAAADWVDHCGVAPLWRSRVTNESATVMDSPKLREARRFKSADGVRREYLWHARYGSNGRIHFRFEREGFLVEIGYIGIHL